jgi:hypothetical protein
MSRPAKYNWDRILNGRRWKLSEGKHFDVDVETFRRMAHVAGNRRGIVVRSHLVDETTIAIKAVL